MRIRAFAAAAAALFAFPASAFSQGIEFGPGGVRIVEPPYNQGRSISGGQCRELRRACLHKEEQAKKAKAIAADIVKSAAKVRCDAT